MNSDPTAVDEALARSKERELQAVLRDMGSALVAFSAGVDSTYLLAVAHEQLGASVSAITADSPSLARRSLAEAEAFCAEHGIDHRLVATDEFDDDDYAANTGLRCYACKSALMRAMQTLNACMDRDGDQRALLVGVLSEDFDDYRPGLRAAREGGARWPLAEVGLHKDEVRLLSRRRGLKTWDRPAEPCLSSRLPYGEAVTRRALAMVEAAEDLLHDLGLRCCRARHHSVGGGRGALCRIEVPVDDIQRVVAMRERLDAELRRIGYLHVAVDLGGLRSGGFNALVTASETTRR